MNKEEKQAIRKLKSNEMYERLDELHKEKLAQEIKLRGGFSTRQVNSKGNRCKLSSIKKEIAFIKTILNARLPIRDR